MNNIYGASPETWLHWRALGLGPDLLPVVCQPDLPVSSSSQLTSYGKVPSRFDRQGHVVGFPKWTQYRATMHDLTLWSMDQRLGICLQTRSVRAIDIDVDDESLVEQIVSTVREVLGSAPLRTRANSPKCLLLFKMPGEFSKQVLATHHGMIEFLATGQQCVVAGTHPSGARYEWACEPCWGWRPCEVTHACELPLPTSLPELTVEQFEDLKELLSRLYGTKPWTAGRAAKARDAGSVMGTPMTDDPVAAYLLDLPDLVTAQHADRIDVLCPWASDHTSKTDASSTSYFPAGTGGFETGSFRCLHAHCSERSTSEFLMAIGYMAEGFEDISGQAGVGNESLQAFLDGVPAIGEVPHPCALPAFERQPKTGKIKPILNNLLLFLDWLCEQGEGIRFDVFRDEILMSSKGGGERSFTDADYSRLQARAELGLTGFAPLSHELMRRAVHLVAQNRCFDSAQAWIDSLEEWDGVDRITRFCHHYLGSEDTVYATAVSRYLWSAMAGRILKPGIQADMSVILVSDQGTGKSTSIRSMAPMRDCYIDLSLSDRDADLARLTRGKTLVELSELRGLHTKEMDAIKAFVTRLESEWVPKYFEMRTIYLRRFIMIGTTNNDEFLGDATGERRWLPLRVGRQEIDAIRRDHTQLWSQARSLFLANGILWEDAQRLGADEHAEFSTHDAIMSKLEFWLSTEEHGVKPCEKEFLTLYEVMREGFGYELRDVTRPNQMRVADILRRLGFTSTQKWLDGKNCKVWVKKPSPLSTSEKEGLDEFF